MTTTGTTGVVITDKTYTLVGDEWHLVLESHLENGVWVWNDINGYGNALDNRIDGNPGVNEVWGYGGNDLLYPGAGDDTVYGGDGDDQVYAGDDGQPIYDADWVDGGAGNDELDGGLGNDTLIGGTGDDLYKVRDALDVVSELGGDGLDQVEAFVDFTLPDGVEELELYGAAANGTGNDLGNFVQGNEHDNVLDGKGGDDELEGQEGNDSLLGGTGADWMAGGLGDDAYEVDDALDRAVERAGEGVDLVYASVNWTLTANLEHLQLTGIATQGAGNAGANDLFGNQWNNQLDGRGGADRMYGAEGDDLYVVDNAMDRVIEYAGEGVDQVHSYIDFILNAQVENLTLVGTAAVDGTGSAQANVLTGNAAANLLDGKGGADRLVGMGGDDVLEGGTGKDVLVGSAGLDTFVFDTALNAVTNVDTVTFVARDDTIHLENAIFTRFATAGVVLEAANFKANAAGRAMDRNDYIVYETDTGKVFYDADGSGAGKAVQFATLVGAPAITAADFFVV